MFQDFDDNAGKGEGRGRMGVSFGVSLVLFGVVVAFLATMVATARAVVRHREVSVEFAELPPAPEVDAPSPPPPPPPPPPRRRRGPRPRAHRPNMRPPTVIPDEQPEESDDALTDAGDVGPVDGFLDGTDDGDGDGETTPPPPPAPAPPPPAPRTPPPSQRRESVSRPRFLSGCRAPEVPESLRTSAATVRIDVRILVGADGVPMSVRILRASPLVPDGPILECARSQRFEPARLSDGTAIPYPFTRRFVFRPSNL